MKILKTITSLSKELELLRGFNNSIGFVPTMGSLHDGHLSLVKKSLKENKSTVVSIFVNPTQFNSNEDLSSYPIQIEKDCFLLKNISTDILVFIPSVEEIYPNGLEIQQFNFKGLDRYMEGTFRKTHFNGVATVVKSLLNTVNPTASYFGKKDFQQFKIIELIFKDYNIIGCETVRDKNGLALSSRNKLLTSESRLSASKIYNNLIFVKTNLGKFSVEKHQEMITNNINSNKNMSLEYFVIADENKLEPTLKLKNSVKYRSFIAVFVDGVRLIDNIALY